jgi:hypothetical protein
MKKGDNVADVADEEDDDAVRTSVSQDGVTATPCTEELFLRTSSLHISDRSNVGGGDTDGQHDT